MSADLMIQFEITHKKVFMLNVSKQQIIKPSKLKIALVE